MESILVLFILLSDIGYIASHLTASVRGYSDGKCMTNLMNGLVNEAFSSSSYQDNFYPYHAKVIFDKPNNNNSSGLAWCPKGDIGHEPTEWIQVSFDNLKMISNIFTYGRDSGNFGFFVPTYHFDYQRENGSLWNRYRELDGKTIIVGNSDPRNSQVKSFTSNIVVKTIRIYPISYSATKVCLRFTLYGCDFNDGVVEYSIPQGNILTDSVGQTYPLQDRVYDGPSNQNMLTAGSLLYGGMGQLMDNQINTNSIQSTKDQSFNFVGWHSNYTKLPLQMIFRFDQVRQIQSLQFHVLNNFNDKISIFSSVKVEFSVGGERYGVRSGNIIYKHEVDNYLTNARWMKISLNNSVARYIRLTFTFHLPWIVITEIEFETKPINFSVAAESTENESVLPNKSIQNDNGINRSEKVNFLLILFGALVAIVLLVIVIIFFLFRVRRHRKHRFKGKSNQSIFYGNMPSNNVIPIPVATSSNGGFYKPVPSGVYDCMLPYQSQTMNVRNAAGFPSQQVFGTFNNRGAVTTTTNNMINGINSDNYNTATSPIVRQHSFNQNIHTRFPENKRASFDDSYGNGSNQDYSNLNLNRDSTSAESPFLPMHLIAMSPIMFNQYQNPANGHQIAPIQVRIPYSSPPFATDRQPLDPSMIQWPEEFNDIIVKHSRSDLILQSPVGGSLLRKIIHGYEDLGTVDDYERNICTVLPCIEGSEIDVQSLIGSGHYGSIFKALYNGSNVAIKSIDRTCIPTLRTMFLKTISDLMRISNRNISAILGYCRYDNSESTKDQFLGQVAQPIVSGIIVEHSRYLDLHTFIRTNFKNDSDLNYEFSEEQATDTNNKSILSHSCLVYIASQISNGMCYLESEQIVHRDLAARNCLLGPRLSIKITDTAMDNAQFRDDYLSMTESRNDLENMGLMTPLLCPQPDISLPLYWMSWESVLKGEYSNKSDIWSFGIVLWEILTDCQSRPYFTVPQKPNIVDFLQPQTVQCLSLIHNFKSLSQGLDNALLPNNGYLSHIRDSSDWTCQQPLYIPPLNISELHTNDNNCHETTSNHILNSSREMRDLIESCWLLDPSMRPNFRDINTFLDQKINGFNADEEYQVLQAELRNKVEESVGQLL